MSNWKTYKLGELVKFQRGHDLSKTEFVDGDIPIAGSNGIIGYHNKYTCKAPCITIGRSGSLGTPYFYNKNIWAHNTTLYVKEFYNSDPKFMYYLLQTIDFKKFNSGSAVPSLNRNYIHPIEVLAPEFHEQQRIASILSSFDDKIELNRQTNQTLEAIAKTFFQEMCVPKGMELPEGWSVKKISEIGQVITGKTPSSKNPEHFDGNLPFVTPTDFKNYSKIILSAIRFLSKQGVVALKNKVLPKNSVIVTCIGSDMGKVVINKVKCITNQQINSIIVNETLTDFLYYSLMSKYELLRNMATGGSTMPMINKSQFEEIELIVPKIEILENFRVSISAINEQIENNEKENQTLIALLDSLLPKLMKGEIEI